MGCQVMLHPQQSPLYNTHVESLAINRHAFRNRSRSPAQTEKGGPFALRKVGERPRYGGMLVIVSTASRYINLLENLFGPVRRGPRILERMFRDVGWRPSLRAMPQGLW